jgi:hypothetical protein
MLKEGHVRRRCDNLVGGVAPGKDGTAVTTIGEHDTGIALPGDPAFDAATEVFNLAAPARPAAAVIARTIDQIQDALRYARSTGRRIRVHATGHAAAARPPMDGAVLIATRLGGAVEVDGQVARIPAGTRWGAVVAAAAEHGLAAPHGSSPTVGVVGYLLGGGMSFYGRRIGLAANSVRALELITADGARHRVDATADPELFWAMRGGGGGFGVVTHVEIELFPMARVITGASFWPAAYAEQVLSTWRQWTLWAPWEVTTSARMMNLPPLPSVPPELAAGPVVCVDGAVACVDGDETTANGHAAQLLEPLRAIATPVLDTWHLATAPAVLHAHLDPTDPVPFIGDHMLLGDLGDRGVAEFVRVLGEGSGSPLIVATLRQLGGAYAVADPRGGVLNHLDAQYAYMGSGAPFEPVTPASLRAHCDTVRAALSPWDTGQTAPSFVESFEQPQGHLTPEQVRAVDEVRMRVDPSGLFRDDAAPQSSALS